MARYTSLDTNPQFLRVEFTQRAERLEAVAKTMLDRHRATDAEELVLVTSDHGVP
jgi:hypothetical protein